MDQELVDSKEPHVSVKLIVKRDEFRDAIFGTGEWEKGETKLVPRSVADKMFRHTDVYAPGTPAEAGKSAQVVTFDKAKEDAKKLEQVEERAVRDSINAMPKDKLIEYAAVHYGKKIPATKSEENIRADVVILIDQHGVR